MPAGFELTPELLATQGRALRGLARSLLGDPHAAEDVVQETWLACLRHPDTLPVRVSAWLGTVTRRLALRRLRGERRREARERNTAAPERLEAFAQRSLEREEALRAVTNALLSLEEPFKTALLLRYYEDRPPSAIAAELGLPLATVKSRLARGLDKLRAKLGAELRGDEASRTRALLALAGLQASSSVSTGAATAGGIALGLKLQAGAALVVALVGAAVLWWPQRADEHREVAAVAPEPFGRATGAALVASSNAKGPAPLSDDAQHGKDRREAVAAGLADAETAEAFPPEASFPYRISGRLRDERDQPLENAHVYLAPRLFPFNHAATTDAEGRFTLELDGRRPAMEIALAAAGQGCALDPRELSLVSGRELVVDLSLRSTVRVHAAGSRVLIALGSRAGSEPLEINYDLEAPEPGVVSEAAAILEQRVGGLGVQRLDCAPQMLRRASGRGLFVDPPPAQACTRGVIRVGDELLALEGAFAGFEGLPLWARLEGIDALVGGEASRPATVRGVVRDRDGAPVEGAEVGWGAPGRAPEGWTKCDASGAFVLDGVPPGEHVLRAGGGDHGLAELRVALAAGQELPWDPVLDRGDELRGRLVLAEGGLPLEDVRVELDGSRPGFVWSDATRTRADGRFAFPNVPAGALELRVFAGGEGRAASAFPIRVVRPVFAPGDAGDLVLGVGELECRTLGLTALDGDDERVPGTELRVWHEASGLGALAEGPDEDGRLALAGLPGGAYRIELGSPLGWRDLGRVWLDPRVEGGLDLGTERFAAPGHVALAAEPVSGRVPSLALWSAHADVFGFVARHDEGRALVALRPGEYVLGARAGADGRCETPFEVLSGDVRALAVEPGTGGALLARPGAVDPALASVEAVRCTACHAGQQTLGGAPGDESRSR